MGGEPFVKWAGGKRLLADRIVPLLPAIAPGRRYYEPFVGGGAVFFALAPKNAFLSDVNAELIEAYAAVRDNVDLVIDHLRRYAFSSEEYYRVRDSRPRSSAGRAARFIYLNKTCFNGLYRVNLKGEFNVPIGRHKNVLICDREQLRTASRLLRKAVLKACDFEDAVSGAQAGDLVYLDPPYTTAHTNNGFIEYNARVFAWTDQTRLARVAADLVNAGVHVAVSNAAHPSIRTLFRDSRRFRIHRIPRWSTIAGDAGHRYMTAELLIVGNREARRSRGTPNA